MLPWTTELGEEDVAVEVAQLAEQGEREGHEGLCFIGGGIEGVVDKVGHKGGKAPVVGAVLEEAVESE